MYLLFLQPLPSTSHLLRLFFRFERLKSERTTTNEEHLAAIRHMTLQNESVAATFKVCRSISKNIVMAELYEARECERSTIAEKIWLCY